MAESVLSSLDPQKHLDEICKYADAGYDHIYIHQIGPKQEEFFKFYEKEILPEVLHAPDYAKK